MVYRVARAKGSLSQGTESREHGGTQFPSGERPDLKWPTNQLEILREYTFKLTPDDELFRGLERILHLTQHQQGSMRAQRKIPIDTSPLTDLAQLDFVYNRPEAADETVVNLTDQTALGSSWSSEGYRRGFGSWLHGSCRGNIKTNKSTYESWAAEALLEICGKS